MKVIYTNNIKAIIERHCSHSNTISFLKHSTENTCTLICQNNKLYQIETRDCQAYSDEMIFNNRPSTKNAPLIHSTF